MYPIASQFVFEGTNSRCCARISESDASRFAKRSQFEIEDILKSTFCDSSVTAGSEIEKNASSHQFSFDQISLDEKLPKKFAVGVRSDGLIAPQDSAIQQKFWFRNIRIADDIPGANILLGMKDDKIEVRTIKMINISSELLLWFSEEILSFMGIPFLTPANIQGE